MKPRLREPDLLQWCFTPVEVLDAVRAAYQGAVVRQVYEGNRVVDVTVVLDPEIRRDISRLGELPLRNGDGVYLRLSRLADVFESDGRYQVLHQGARRCQTVTANVAGRDVGSFVTEARSRLSRMTLPPGVHIDIGGAADAQARSRHNILLHSALAGLGIVILLSLVTRHPRNLGRRYRDPRGGRPAVADSDDVRRDGARPAAVRDRDGRART